MRKKSKQMTPCQCGSRWCENIAEEFEGWISPEGEVFRLAFGHHEIFADHRLKRTTGRDYKSKAATSLLNLGWISFGGIGYSPFNSWKEPTQAQIDAVFDICQECEISYSDVMGRLVSA